MMPQRFDLKYIGADNAEHRPVVIHRAIFGSIERFIAILIEHFAGAFPLWLAPVQVARAADCGSARRVRRSGVQRTLADAGLRAELDERQEKINYKIREAQLQKVPYMLVIGDREAAEQAVAVRSRAKGDLGARPRRGSFWPMRLPRWRQKRYPRSLSTDVRYGRSSRSFGRTLWNRRLESSRRTAVTNSRRIDLSLSIVIAPAVATTGSASTNVSASVKSA